MDCVIASVQLEVINCWVCGCTFAMSATLKNEMKSRDETLFCPKGCRLGLGEPEWKKEMERLQQSEAYYKARSIAAEHWRNRLTATKGVVTRMKNRISKGVCPCCNRSFDNLKNHMATKHLSYSEE